MGGGIFATTFWLLWQNGGGVIVTAPDAEGVEFTLSSVRLHYNVEES